jgi:thiosulfate/3-mercaptopyruvate sulfurtransferase
LKDDFMYSTLISAHELNAVHDVFIIDCSFDLADATAGEAAYALGHLPGAVYLHLDRDLSGEKHGTPPSNGRHPLPNARKLVDHLASISVKTHQQIIAYDRTGGMYAARLWWMLRWLGHAEVAVLDGGLQAWQAAGFTLSTEVSHYAPGNFEAAASLESFVQKGDVKANLQTREKLVIDARAPERFRGEQEAIDPVAGHIPGAVNRFFKENLQADGRFKTAAQLREEFNSLIANAGNFAETDVIAHCGSGVTACHHLLAMRHAGLQGAQLYPGSWSEWSADKSLPVALGN